MKFNKQTIRAAGVLAATAAATAANAALPASVTSAVEGAGTDTLAAIALMIGVVVGIWGLRKVMGLFGK